MELTIIEIVYLAMAISEQLKKDMGKTDRIIYENLLCRLAVCEKGMKIREAFEVRI